MRMDVISNALAKNLHRQNQLELRIAHLEEMLGHASAAIVPVRAMPEVQAVQSPTTPPPVPFAAAGPIPSNTHAPPPLETRLGLHWLNRVAVITLLFGVGFFFKYAADSGWIGPGMRVALGIVAGTAALAGGEWMWLKGQRVFAQGITGLGLALLYLSFYASFAFYHLVPQSAAFALMSLTTIGVAFLSIHYNAQVVAILGLLGGFLTPPLIATGEDRPYTLAFYTLLLSAGAAALAHLKGWRAIVYLSFAGTAVLYGEWAANERDLQLMRNPAMLWISLGFLLFLFATRLAGPGLLLMNAVGSFAAAYSLLRRPFDDWMGALAAAFAAAHFLWALAEEKLRMGALAIAVGFLTLAIPLQFSSFRVVIAWAIEAAVLAWLAARGPWRTGPHARIAAWYVLVCAIARLAISDAAMYPLGEDHALVANFRFFTFASVAASLWFNSLVSTIARERNTLYATGHFVMLWSLLLESAAWSARNFNSADVPNVASLAVSLVVALYAFGLVAAGVLRKRWLDRVLALGLLVGVIAKLYLRDVWDLSRGLRILAFLALGAVLLLVSFLYSHFKPVIERLLARIEEPAA